MYSMNIEIHFFPKPFKLEFSVFAHILRTRNYTSTIKLVIHTLKQLFVRVFRTYVRLKYRLSHSNRSVRNIC